MAKKADKYFSIDPWKIVEEGFNNEYGSVAESIFSLGNEYMGVRGFFEEGYTGDSLLGCYFNGVYERKELEGSAYKGITRQTEFMVNSPNWLYTRIKAGDEQMDLNTCQISDFKRTLDMKTGVMTRSFLWKTANGDIRVSFERFLSMDQVGYGAQKIVLESVDYEGDIEVKLGYDAGIIHQMRKENFWEIKDTAVNGDSLCLLTETKNTGFGLQSCSKLLTEEVGEPETNLEEKTFYAVYRRTLKKQEKAEYVRIVRHQVLENGQKAADWKEADVEEGVTYESLLKGNKKWWQEVWEHSDITIEGDEENQQGIRFCIFQMFSTYHGAKPGANIGAKGLTGEAYNGNAFWDTETYCLPFFLFQNQEAARNLLLFRYQTLPEAKKRADALDCKGAFYPIATISGRECCDLWQHASLQLQASTGVAYGIWAYEKISGDDAFVSDYGLEMLIEISRMLASRGDWSGDGKYYGYYAVMGPDEFQMMVNHNCYTNAMAKFTFTYALRKLAEEKTKNPQNYERLVQALGLKDEELEEWKRMADGMYIPKDEESSIYEQQEGFFKLPHVDVDAIPIEDFPLYHHWSYDRIYRNDMIKQPDVLMLMLLFNHSFTEQELLANYEYYEPRCIHESSLSPSVHSILALQLGKYKEAYDFFAFATRMDLDNYNRNSNEGLHTTSIAAAWMNIVYGFGGMRSDGDGLEFTPMIPAAWKSYSFRVCYRGAVLVLTVGKEELKVENLNGVKVEIKVYGKEYVLDKGEVLISIPEERREEIA